MNNLKTKNKALWVTVMLLALVVLGSKVLAYSSQTAKSPQSVIENNGGTVIVNHAGGVALGSEELSLGAAVASDASHLSQEPKPTALGSTYFSDDIEIDGVVYGDGAATFTGVGTFGSLLYLESSTNLSATTSITSAMSGKTFYISGATSTYTLPATSSAIIGATYRFVVGGAMTASSSIKTASGADEIEGTLIVAGAVVDCDAEDEIVVGGSLENIGDYVELRWSGTYWMIGDSGALTSLALACTKT